MYPEAFFVFLAATLAVNLSPGPSILYVSSVAASNGVKAGIISVVGMSVGIFVHVLAAATGVAALIVASETAFIVLKYTGATYLVYLGLRFLLTTRWPTPRGSSGFVVSSWAFFRRGILVDLLNPKIGVFFLAFFPQFLGSADSNAFLHTVVLGMVFIVVGGSVNGCIAVAAAKGMKVVGPRARPWIERWIPGGILACLGVRLGLDEQWVP